MLDDVYYYTRLLTFVWAGLLFFVLVYWGIIDMMQNRKCAEVHIPPEFELWAFSACLMSFVIAYGTGENLYGEIKGGPRLFVALLPLVPSTIACKQGIFRVRMHRDAIRRGICK